MQSVLSGFSPLVKKISRLTAYFNSEVQCGHLVASMEISLLQYGQIFVAGAGAAGGAGFLSLFIVLITINKTKATIKKLMTADIKLP